MDQIHKNLVFIIDNITKFRYNLVMTLKQYLNKRNISGYYLSKATKIPYMTICDLLNGKTNIKNVSLKNALAISSCLNIDVNYLASFDDHELVSFRYFRNNTLHALKRKGYELFIKDLIKDKEIDFYSKNNGLEQALYLVSLIDYLCRINNLPIYDKRYNSLRKRRLERPFFVGSDLLNFKSIEQAEKEMGISVIPEFKEHNIIEENVFNVA